MTNEQLRQTGLAMIAHAEGKPVQIASIETDNWETYGENEEPRWLVEKHRYRPKPEPVTRPWSKPDDVPGPVCWVRPFVNAVVCDLIVTISDKGFMRTGPVFTTWDDTADYEYSIDRRTWQPCTITEEAK